jgi:glycosyltransferase involved in cell wall biosynthesis
MLTTVGDRCGIAAYSRDLAAELRKLVDLTVVPIEPGKLPLARYEEQARELNRADVVHIQHEHSFWGGILPNHSAFWNLRYLIQKPVVLTAHTTTSLSDLLRVRDERRLPHRIAKTLLVWRRGYRDSVEIAPFVTGRCIVHTEDGKSELVARGANPKYIHVIPAGIPDRLPAERVARELPFDADGRRIVALFGYLAPNKGYEVALQALRELPDDVMLVIAGGTRSAEMEPYAQSLVSLIEEMKLTGRVAVTGFLPEESVAAVMERADVVIAPHTYATGSYSITIPLAYGKAIVASDLPCFAEIAAEGEILQTVPAGDSRELAAAMRDLLENDVSRRMLEERASGYASRRTWPAVAERTVAIYREAILDVDRLSHHQPAAARR